MTEDMVENGDESCDERVAEEAAGPDRQADHDNRPADHDLVMAAARRIIASDAAIIHRLGTV
ncbi:hypothetical protein ABIA31_001520 [Catenulispora sp. MAP5-51]|uniref:hypothetical protein n=1 Tax=Catenulispora sp. MAP5-51 TaxID=3156298 RepID=UPI003517FA21